MANSSKLLPPRLDISTKGTVLYAHPGDSSLRPTASEIVELLEEIERTCKESSDQCTLFDPQYAMLPDCVHGRIVAMIKALSRLPGGRLPVNGAAYMKALTAYCTTPSSGGYD